MKKCSKLWLAGGLTAALVGLTGCSGSSDDGNVNAGGTQGSSDPASVPDNAGSTVAAFIAYMIGLDPNDEKSEPLRLKDNFAVPPDDASDSQPIT